MKKNTVFKILFIVCFAFLLGLTSCSNNQDTTCDHKWETIKVIQEATCTNAASRIDQCTLCQQLKTVFEPALGHDYELFEGKLPTCTQSGYKPYGVCKVDGCGYSTYKELPALNHKNSYFVPGVDATCLKNGNKAYYYCPDCNKTFEDEDFTKELDEVVINAKGHQDVEHFDFVNSTCIRNGNIEYWHCNDCNTNFKDSLLTLEVSNIVISSINHVNKEYFEYVGSTCTTDGNIEYWHCSDCKKDFTDEECTKETENTVINKTNHANKVHHQYAPATCTTDGSVEYWACPDCNKNFSDEACTTVITNTVVNALNHPGLKLYEAKAATCEADGNISYYYCGDCDKCYLEKNATSEITKESTKISKLGHRLTSIVKTDKQDPTCTVAGNIDYWTCNDCKQNFSDEECKTLVEDVTIQPLNHPKAVCEKAKDPTCTEVGNIEYYYCSLCTKYFEDKEYKTEITLADTVVSATGHKTSFVAKIDETCGANGQKAHYHCSACSKNFEDEEATTLLVDLVVPATGNHSFNAETGICSVCGALDKEFTEGLSFSYNSTLGGYEVKGYTGSSNDIIIPYFYNDGTNGDKPVVSIAKNAFQKNTSITSVVMKNSVTVINENAFNNCSNLTSVILSNKLTEIKESGFSSCSKLPTITLPQSLTTLGSFAFSSCTILNNITLPSNLETIKNNAFQYCKGLTSINIPEKITKIDLSTFDGCTELATINFATNSSLQTIDQYAFENTKLITIALPEGVTSLGDRVFENCTSLTSVSFPKTLTSLGKLVFKDCSALTTFIIDSENPTFIVYDDTANNGGIHLVTKDKKLVYTIGNYPIPTDGNVVDTISKGLFSYRTDIERIVIPSNIITIEENAFYYCNNANFEVEFAAGSQLTTIGKEAFRQAGFKTITIPKSVTSLGEWAFYKSKLETIIFETGSTIKYFDNGPFNGCESLKSITLPGSLNSLSGSAFSGCTNLETVIISEKDPSNTRTSFYINSNAFWGCTSLKTVYLPSDFAYCQKYAFNLCSALEEIFIPKSCFSLGERAFNNCTKLKYIKFEGTEEEWNSIDKGTDWNKNAGSEAEGGLQILFNQTRS